MSNPRHSAGAASLSGAGLKLSVQRARALCLERDPLKFTFLHEAALSLDAGEEVQAQNPGGCNVLPFRTISGIYMLLFVRAL